MILTDVLIEEAGASYAIADRLFHRVADKVLSWTPAEGKKGMQME